ncbi:MarR family winged helix-turn-helix transcriptional regulator [Pseudoclavibacter sp. RFBA6]|uniref:MarR family winged helix-turn-helix transcriptional regulator n=1 Tax=Pseudoclavibacter sp. RFBA6 TaxID=2080573 RepID=UPI000CE8CCB1|nr:MarR family transcriptional regulator [Pseudoclavibacter sp. RFBA6]PPG42022.1 MarR family transcriptional regulator [Pseudoclavibacter sp. RFBA6]
MQDERAQKLSEALFAVYDVVARTNDALEPALQEFALTAVTAHLLWVIDPDAPAPSMSTAAERTHCTPQNVTFMCHQLEAKGLVTRKPSPTDLRQRVIELTTEGRVARDAIVKLASTSSPFAGVDESDLTKITELLGSTPSRQD